MPNTADSRSPSSLGDFFGGSNERLKRKGSDSKFTEKDTPSSSVLRPEGGVYPVPSKYDCCAFVIHCVKHKKVAVSGRHGVVWLPFTPMPTT